MKTQTAFRIHNDTRAEIARIAEKRHLSMNSIVQIALDEYIERFKADEEIPPALLHGKPDADPFTAT